jgi:PAS domain S-box-containing protein
MGNIISISKRKRVEQRLRRTLEGLETVVEERTAAVVKAYRKLKQEIEERKQAEEALRESEEKYRTVLEASPDPIAVYDMEGKVIYLNPAFTRVFGWTWEELLGKKIDYVPKENWPETQMMIDIVLAGEGFSGIKSRRYTRKRSILDVSISVATYSDPDGIPVGSVHTLRDLTDRKRMEEEKKRLEAHLRRVEKMEALGTLAGGVAHDLNNILSGLVSYPELLLMDLAEDSPLRRPILTMQNSGIKAVAVVQDLLTLARRGVDVTKVVNVNDIISDYFRSPEHEKLKAFHTSVQFETNLEAELLNILGSSVHLSKTVMNLISNAAEALPDGGTVTISTRSQYIDRPIRGYDEVKEGDYVVLSVADNGIGISAVDLERIFEPFYTKKAMGKSGTGLGMAVVWGTVKDHNGYIDVQSTVGEGTAFDLYFPVTRREAEQGKTPTSIEEYMGHDETVLVVDDVQEQREIASVMLSRLGYCVNTVSSGEEAVEYMKTNSADLLILDMIMDPGIDGFETYRRIVELHPGQKAIIASGYSETDRVREAQRLGAGPYIKKPYTLEKIGLSVKTALEK